MVQTRQVIEHSNSLDLSFLATNSLLVPASFLTEDRMFIFGPSHKLLRVKVTKLLQSGTCAVLQHWCMNLFYFVAFKLFQSYSSFISACSKDQIQKYFGYLTESLPCLTDSCFNSLPLSLPPLMKQPFKCCLSFTFSAEWKMFLRDSVSSCPSWRLELKALDGSIERSPIERSPTNRWQKAFRVINVVQTT